MAIIRKWQILGEKGKFGQKWRVCQKFIKGLAKYSNEMTKRSILTNNDFTKMTNLEKTYLGLANIKTRWQKRYVDNCGLYENYIFCETGEFGKDWDNDTTKQAYWQLGIFTKMGNLGKGGTEEKSIHDVTKPQWGGKKAILTKGKFPQIIPIMYRKSPGDLFFFHALLRGGGGGWLI